MLVIRCDLVEPLVVGT